MTATFNGQDVAVQADQHHWARFARTWRDGDCLTVKLPMQLRVSRLGETAYPAAIQYGPVTLAFDDTLSYRKLDLGNLAAGLKRDPTRPLTWTVAAAPSIQARPFYSFAQGEQYFMYITQREGDHISRRGIKFTGSWNDASVFRYTNAVGASAEASFEGTGIRWLGKKYDDAGTVEVTIDGKVIGVVDQYAPKRDLPFEWTCKGLTAGKHTIRLRLLEAKNPKSRERFINVTGFDVLP